MAPPGQEGGSAERFDERHGAETGPEREDPRAEARRNQRRRLGELLDRTAVYYLNYLWGAKEAAGAREYLRERGLDEAMLREFGIGYAPDAWDEVLLRGVRAGYRIEELRTVGLVQQGRNDSEYDRFRGRITFPIRDRDGHTLGFGARTVGNTEDAKYINTSGTDFFRKGRTLFGIDLAKETIAATRRAIVVEGYTDALALHQAGIREAVGLMGVAFTGEHVAELSDLADEVVVALDPDTTGREATLRAQRIAADQGMRVRVAALPAGEDPAEVLATEDGVGRFQALVEAATG